MTFKQHLSTRDKLLLITRTLALMVLCFGIYNPPASAAQDNRDRGYGTVKDAVQDEQIASLKANQVVGAELQKENARDIAVMSETIGEMRGEERGLFGALALLQSLQMVLQLRKRGEERKSEPA